MASPFKNTLQVWHALFLRESLDRFFGGRAAWMWLFVEPASHILVMALIFGLFRPKGPGGTDISLWLSIGMIGFFLFRRTAMQSLHAVDCNKAFFAFRQVRPFDAALARGSVEGFSMFFVALAIMLPLAFFKPHDWPVDPILLLAALFGLWLLGMGYGIVTSVIQRLVPEAGFIFGLIFGPLYFGSFIIIPIEIVPARHLHWVLWNPIFHGVELLRGAYFPHYPVTPGTSLFYLYLCSLILWLAGLVLFKLFDTRLLTR